MVDRTGSTDRDDAVWVEPTANGWRAHIHIAAVADHISAGTKADIEALRRGSTRYLPDRTIRMLPQNIQDQASLTPLTSSSAPHERTPVQKTCRISIDVAGDGLTTGITVTRGSLTKAVALNYEATADAIHSPGTNPDPDVGLMLTHAYQLATALLNARRTHGALAGYNLTAGWAIDEDGRPIRLAAAERNAGYLVIAELMVAANTAVAEWCLRKDLPILFRNHRPARAEPPRDQLLDDAGLAHLHAAAGGDEARQRLTMLMRPALYEPHVGGHHALALAAYTHATSPLRRYSDLVNQRIMLAAVDDLPAPYTTGALAAVAERLNVGAQQLRDARHKRFKQADQRRSRQRLQSDVLPTLDPTAFHRVLKVAVRETAPTSELVSEVSRRADNDSLTIADAQFLLFTAGECPPEWSPVRARVAAWLAADPPRAVTVLAMQSQINDEPAPEYTTSVAGPPHQPVFTSTVRKAT
jgi:ribonuclease R